MRFRNLDFESLEGRRLLAADISFSSDIFPYQVERQNDGSHAVGNDPSALALQGNAWRAVQQTYNITPDTILSLQIAASELGSLHGVGIDTNLVLDSTDKWFQVFGTDQYGNNSMQSSLEESPLHVEIPIGQHFQGFIQYVTFGAAQSPDALTTIANVQLYEGGARLTDYALVPYGGSAQNPWGSDTVAYDESAVHLQGNVWQAMPWHINVTPNTVLEFDFTSNSPGELQGIGLDTDLKLSSDNWFNLMGSQDNFGLRDFEIPTTTAPQTVQIPIGEFFTGEFNYLTFGNDDDRPNPQASSTFSNIRVFERSMTWAPDDFVSYGGPAQDVSGDLEVYDNGRGMRLSGNGWKALPLNYNVTPSTMLEFDFYAGATGELHGIGVDDDLELSSDSWFRLHASQQAFGIRDLEKNDGLLKTHYTAPIGEYFQGEMKYLTFGNDHDVPNPTGTSYFENVRIYEREESVRDRTWHSDILVYGGTSAGVMAAVQASRMGHSVVLVEPGAHVGGMTASGLGQSDTGYRRSIGGLAGEFYERIQQHYQADDAWTRESPEDYSDFVPTSGRMYRFEPHVAEQVFSEMLDEARVPIVHHERLDLSDGVIKNEETIVDLIMESGRAFHAEAFVDATYEGDLLANAGVSYVTGREANSVYGEHLNGVNRHAELRVLKPEFPVNGQRIPGDPDSGVIAGVHPDPIGPDGSGDGLVQAYNYRLTLSFDPDNQTPFTKPADYDEDLYELYFRYFEAGNRTLPFSLHPMPNRKTDSNGASGFSTDFVGRNHEYVEADYAERERIVNAHRSFMQGLLWTLAHHPRIPAVVRDQVSSLGLAADEYTDNENWPFQLYVREARRMVSDYVMTEHDVFRQIIAEDPVGLGSYPTDSHLIQRYLDEDGNIAGEGGFYYPPHGPFAISYRAIVPKAGEVSNLTTPISVSSSHVGFGAIRLEPVYMILGQSAATIAAMSVEQGVAVQSLNYDALREQLVADGQVLDIPEFAQPITFHAADDLEGIVVDDAEAEITGRFGLGFFHPHINYGYITDGNSADGAWAAEFSAEVRPRTSYEVRVYFSPQEQNATNVPILVRNGNQATQLTLNQREDTGLGYSSLGVFKFKKSLTEVTFTNDGVDGVVQADAIQLVPVKSSAPSTSTRPR